MMTSLESKSMKKNLLTFPSPSNISIWWNFGSLLGMSLLIQIISGFILSMNYCPNINMAFSSIIYINTNIYNGWIMRNIHINGASLFFLFMYIHIFRGIYNFSFSLFYTWVTGIMILLISMMTAFMGYILPWGQMSFWGATVITNLLSVIPVIGQLCVEWVWGGFSVNNATLNRFFSLHFVLPMLMVVMIFLHIFSLHTSGSSNPMGTKSLIFMAPFHPYFTIKDLLGFIMAGFMSIFISTQTPDLLMDPDNFTEANSIITPTHIKPEWYFLFAYAILRSVPSKIGGVMLLIMSIFILLILVITPFPKMKTMKFYPLSSMLFWFLFNVSMMLMWLGGKPLDYPFLFLAQIYSILYFSLFLTTHLGSWITDKFIFI